MADNNWQKVREIFDLASSLQPEERQNFVSEACGEDKILLAEVESLLSSLSSAESFMETPAVTKVADLIEAETKKLEAGKRFGHYEIIGQIGAGGMGEVYLAKDTRLGRKTAIKVLPGNVAQDRQRMHPFVQEAQSASALNHPNIITIYEIGETDNTHFIATEYIEGETLRARLKAAPMDLKSALEIAIQVASALDAAHLASIVHRDIKPENVMIRPDGLVKVLDFGIAKLTEKLSVTDLESATTRRAQTRPGTIIGTTAYMSPEQALGKVVDARSDIFSFGVMLYELLAGKRPFEGGNAMETIASILNKEPVPLSRRTPEVPHEIERIINKTLRKDREERYQTAKDVLIDLKASTQNSLSPPTSSAEYIAGKISSNKRAAAFGSVILLTLVSFGYWYFFNRAVVKQIESIAVMPFVNESDNADVEYLSDGMTETLINSLSQIPNLGVKSRSSVFRYKGKEFDPKKIAAELNVQAILTGRVVQRGEQMTLSLELIDAQTENILWGNKYERKSSDLVSLQREIARDVSGKLKANISGTEAAKVEKNYTTNPEAYQLYLKGKFFWNKRTGNDLKQAAEFYRQAIEKDPKYALAFSGLAETYVLFSGYDVAPADDSMPLAKAAALRALEIDDSLAEAHTALGYYLTRYEFDLDRSEKEFRRAIELKPNYATAHQWFAINLTVVKRFDESLAELRLAEALDPLSPDVGTDLGAALVFARRYDEAIVQLKRTLVRDPNFSRAHSYLGWAYGAKGMYAEAIAEARTALELSNSFFIKGYLALWLAKSGNRDEALKIFTELKKAASEVYVRPSTLAVVYIGLGNKVEALNQLEKEVSSRSLNAIYLAVLPDVDDLRSEPRFKAMLKRMNLPE